MGNILNVRNLNISFATDAGPVRAVRDLSFDVKRREILAVVGESGSGKSVTAKSIMGLLPANAAVSGSIVLHSRDRDETHEMVKASMRTYRKIRGTDAAMVFQEPSTALNPVFKIGWQIIEGLRAHNPRIRTKDARAQAIEILDKVGIPDPQTRIDYYPHQLSGGQKQRVIIAMALIQNPGLIIADEPTTALDVTVQAEILDLLRRCRDDFGASILLITHNMGVVADLADRVVVMYQGRVEEETDVQSLFRAPAAAYTQKLLAAVPRIGDRDPGSRTVQVAERDREVSEEAPKPIVQAQGLEIAFPGGFGRTDFIAVDGLNLTVEPGEVVGIVGESGSGKTTFGRAVAGLTKVTGGSLQVFGTEMNGIKEKEFKPIRPRIGFVFQDPASSFNPLMTIEECVAEPIRVHRPGLGSRELKAAVGDLLEAVQLPRAYQTRFPHELSGGQRQRASLARSLALEPELIIADEPTSALDVSVQARVLELFTELQRELGFAAIFVSHDLAVVDFLADRIGVIYKGQLVEEGSNEQILGTPESDYTRRLLASLPVPDPDEQADRRRLLAAIRPVE